MKSFIPPIVRPGNPALSLNILRLGDIYLRYFLIGEGSAIILDVPHGHSPLISSGQMIQGPSTSHDFGFIFYPAVPDILLSQS